MSSITPEDAARLLAISREVVWPYPSSSGNPLDADASKHVAVRTLLARRDAVEDAARHFVDAGEIEAATELVANTWRLWMVARDVGAGRRFVSVALDASRAQPSRDRALALYADGLFAFWQGAHEESRARSDEALAAAEAVGDPEALTLAHLGVARALLEDGDHERALEHAVHARRYAERIAPGFAQAPLHIHAQALRVAGDIDAAAALFEESLALNRRIGDAGMVGVELHNLGHVELRRGNVELAARYFAECAETDSDDAYLAALTVFNQAALAAAEGDLDGARRLVRNAQATLDAAGVELAADDRREVDGLRARLGDESLTEQRSARK